MKPYLVLLAMAVGVALQGCGISNDKIIEECKKCEDAGMGYEIQTNMDGIVIRVICTEPKP